MECIVHGNTSAAKDKEADVVYTIQSTPGNKVTW